MLASISHPRPAVHGDSAATPAADDADGQSPLLTWWRLPIKGVLARAITLLGFIGAAHVNVLSPVSRRSGAVISQRTCVQEFKREFMSYSSIRGSKLNAPTSICPWCGILSRYGCCRIKRSARLPAELDGSWSSQTMIFALRSFRGRCGEATKSDVHIAETAGGPPDRARRFQPA